MSESYKQILEYMDDLYVNVSMLARTIERQMAAKEFLPLAEVKKQVTWELGHNIDSPRGWRLTMVTRFLARKDSYPTEHSTVYQILISKASAFDFPTILCAKVEHAPLMEHGICGHSVWSSAEISTLHTENPKWTSFGADKGWYIAKPAYNSAIEMLRGYLLNAFDITNVEKVRENIVEPLTGDGQGELKLTVKQYAFPGLHKAS